MTNLDLHDDFKVLSKAVYGNNLGKTVSGWECVKSKSDENGYYAYEERLKAIWHYI